jgi:hypothetical protein
MLDSLQSRAFNSIAKMLKSFTEADTKSWKEERKKVGLELKYVESI